MADKSEHWSKHREVSGAVYGIKILMALYALGGRYLMRPVMYLVILFYYLICKTPRLNSRKFLDRAYLKRMELKISDRPLYGFKHFLSFGDMIFDKIEAWRGKLSLDKDISFYQNSKETLLKNLNVGRVMLCSHLGNIDALRALGSKIPGVVINAIVFTENAQKFNAVMKQFSSDCSINLIATTSMGADTALLLKDKIDQGQIVAIVGDRISTTKGRNGTFRHINAKFFDVECAFAEGPIVLCSILKCPVQLLFGLKNEDTGKIDIVCEDFADKVELNRKTREEDLRLYAQRYASRLEHYAALYPYQWFNFFDFFKKI